MKVILIVYLLGLVLIAYHKYKYPEIPVLEFSEDFLLPEKMVAYLFTPLAVWVVLIVTSRKKLKKRLGGDK